MTYNPEIHHRRSIRLKGYDYSREGLYFITIDVKDRKCLFGYAGDKSAFSETGADSGTTKASTTVGGGGGTDAAGIVRAKNFSPLLSSPLPSPPLPSPPIPSPPIPSSPIPSSPIPSPPTPTSPLPTASHTTTHLPTWPTSPSASSPNQFPILQLTEAGKIAEQCWLAIPKHFPNVVLHEYVIMPNHVHGIIEIVTGANNERIGVNDEKVGTNDVGANDVGANDYSPLRSPSRTIGSIIRGFKIGVTKWFGYSIWHRDYYEHIIRTSGEFDRITNYIIKNPEKWYQKEGWRYFQL